MTALWLAASLWVAALTASLLLAEILTAERWMSAPSQGLWAWHGLAVATLGAIIIGPLLVAHDVLEQSLIWIVHADKQAFHLLYAGARPVDPRWNYAIAITLVSLAAVLTSSARRWAATRRRRREWNTRTASLRSWKIDDAGPPPPSPRAGQGDIYWSYEGTSTGNLGAQHSSEWVRSDNGRRWRRAQARMAWSRVARRRERVITVLPAEELDAFCIPRGLGGSGSGGIFVTSAAIARLSPEQLHAVVAHEQAHLSRQHHLHVLVADILGGVLRRLGLLGGYDEAVRRLVELDADDAAVRHHGKRAVAAALLEMAVSGPSNTRAGLGMTSTMTSSVTSQRLHRLVTQRAEAPVVATLERTAVSATIVTLVLAPILVLVVPALLLAGSGH